MQYNYSDKPMGRMKGDGKSGISNEGIAKAGAKAVDYSKAAALASPGSKPKQQ